MGYDLSNKLVIGVASSALFDLAESDAFFRDHGEAAYRQHQADHLEDTLQPGVAFPFIRRLLALNDLRADPLVEVIVLSQNDPSTGLRVMRSIEAHDLPMTRAVFTQGVAPFKYIGAFDISLFLSADEGNVKAAMAMGFPAGVVLSSAANDDDDSDGSIRVALDFDGVIASDESERVFQGEGGLSDFQRNEIEKRLVPLEKGPLAEFLRDLNMIQGIERDRAAEDPGYDPRVRVSIVTARNAPAHERAVRTLEGWGVTVNDAFFLGNIDKWRVLQVLEPHIFFDDQKGHLEKSAGFVPSVHIPYGVANESPSSREGAIGPDEVEQAEARSPAKVAVDSEPDVVGPDA